MPETKPPIIDDHSFVSDILSGDAEKFGEFVETCRNRLFRFILKMVPNVSTAEDLAQEAFLQAYRNLCSFSGNCKLSTWVTGIALNLVRNHQNRSPEHRYEMVSDETIFDLACDGDDPQRAYEKKAFFKKLHEAITTLPSDLREALLLVSMENYSYADAAQALGVSEGAVKNRVFRAREMLRTQMSGELFP